MNAHRQVNLQLDDHAEQFFKRQLIASIHMLNYTQCQRAGVGAA
jgi:hypothetical protein